MADRQVHLILETQSITQFLLHNVDMQFLPYGVCIEKVWLHLNTTGHIIIIMLAVN